MYIYNKVVVTSVTDSNTTIQQPLALSSTTVKSFSACLCADLEKC